MAMPTRENSCCFNVRSKSSLQFCVAYRMELMSPILQNHYVLAVHNARRSADFYVQMLGFRIVDEPSGWVFVKKDNCLIMLGECPDDLPPASLGCHSYFA